MKLENSIPALSAVSYIGVDVAKATLQVFSRGQQREIANTSGDYAKLCKDLKSIAGAHVVCEATGGYERGMVRALHKAEIRVSVVNPARVRASAQADGQMAKTDRIDAVMITAFGRRYNPEPTPEVSKVQAQLCALTQWLKQLIDARAVAKTQGEHHEDAFVKKQHQVLLNHYQSQIEKVEAKLDALMETDQELRQRAQCLESIEGVGMRTALLMLSNMPELGQMSRGQAAALAGLAPWTRESGTMKGMRFIGGGRPQVRLALYMAALTASRCNPILSPFYQKLIQKGKLPKVALTAVMRKLLIHMNQKLKVLAAKLPTEIAQEKEKNPCKN